MSTTVSNYGDPLVRRTGRPDRCATSREILPRCPLILSRWMHAGGNALPRRSRRDAHLIADIGLTREQRCAKLASHSGARKSGTPANVIQQ